MMRALILLTAMCATSATAAAQQPMGSRAAMQEEQPADVAVTAARKMVSCLVRTKSFDLQGALDAPDRDAFASRVDRAQPAFTACMSRTSGGGEGSLNLSHSAIYGLLAGEWFQQHGIPRLDAVAYPAEGKGSDWLTSDAGQGVVLRMGDCLAARQPSLVAAVLASKPDSMAEAQAFARLTPEFAGCLQKDVTLQARKSGVRLALASAYYRRSSAPASSAGK